MPEESGLFQITITEAGKKYIRKFVVITPILLVCVFIEAGASVYWNVKTIANANRTAANIGFMDSLYNRAIPYILLLTTLISIVSNIYYLRFPRILLRSIETNDEPGANKSFNILFKGAFIFLVWMLIVTATTIWSFLTK
jgi:hypothetical protein